MILDYDKFLNEMANTEPITGDKIQKEKPVPPAPKPTTEEKPVQKPVQSVPKPEQKPVQPEQKPVQPKQPVQPTEPKQPTAPVQKPVQPTAPKTETDKTVTTNQPVNTQDLKTKITTHITNMFTNFKKIITGKSKKTETSEKPKETPTT